MSSPGQKRGSCGHAMASFDGHLYCARCRDKGKGKDTCVESKDSSDCVHCNALTPEQRAQLATPSYKLKKRLFFLISELMSFRANHKCFM